MRRLAVLVAIVLAIGLSGSALAGDNNNAFIRQVSPAGSTIGNTLRIDQFAARGSLVRGIGPELVGAIPGALLGALTANDPDVAQQRGEGNVADLTLTGLSGELQLYQSASRSAPWVPFGATADNRAVLVAKANALGGVVQVGLDNDAKLTLDEGATGLISQFGSKLTSELEVAANGDGTIVQSGYNSTTGRVTVAGGASLTYVQIGNNLNPTNGLSIFSTVRGNITITQTGW